MSRLAPALITLLLAAPAWAHDRGYGYDHRPAYAYESGRVEVYNGSGGRVTVSLPGQPSAVLEPYRTAVLYAPAGETTLRATYAQFGADRVLKTERVFVQPGRTVRVGLAPERLARVRIVNNSPVSATLLVNGVSKAVLNPGEVRVATLPVGYADLQLLGAGRCRPFRLGPLDLRWDGAEREAHHADQLRAAAAARSQPLAGRRQPTGREIGRAHV